jgi:DNA-binding response OmpR family regulator
MAGADEATQVLLIEDDAVTAAIVAEQLRASKLARFRVRTAETLASARTQLAMGAHHAVIVDLGLPDAFGLQALHAVLEAPRRPVCVVLSSEDAPELALAAMELGAQDFIHKASLGPTSRQEALARRLLAALARHERIERARAAAAEAAEVLDALPDALLVVDPQGRVVSANAAAATLYGRTRDWLIGQRFRADVAEGGALGIRVRRADGETVAAVVRAAPLRARAQPATVYVIRPLGTLKPAKAADDRADQAGPPAAAPPPAARPDPDPEQP